MADIHTIREWVGLLDLKADELGRCPTAQTARDMLMVCGCVEAAVTAYLIKKTVEEKHVQKQT
ncbi:MAG: hypothetical protein M0036_05090 [Desulfobacteraceae bacterium]|nr:hypothetical protein [Desulfobacteraceae bacterium]